MIEENRRPKYYVLMDHLKQAILTGMIKPGSKIPSENILSKEYGVSRHTVRKALSILENEGLIEAEHGRGTYCKIRGTNHKDSHNIAVITTYISDYIFPRLIQGIDNVLMKNGYSIILKNTGNSQKNERKVLEDILTKNIDGLIIEPSKSEICCRHMQQYESLDKLDIPYVFIQATYPQMKEKPYIVMDDVMGGYLLTKYLIDLGHKDIIGIFKVDDLQGNSRHKGYIKALNEAGISYDPDKVILFHTEDRDQKPGNIVRQLVAKGKPMDGIVCYNDLIALDIIGILVDMGIQVPEDVSVTGYDNSFIAESGPIKLTTVAHPKEQLGEMAARLLLEKIQGISDDESKVERVIIPELIIGESCRNRKNKL